MPAYCGLPQYRARQKSLHSSRLAAVDRRLSRSAAVFNLPMFFFSKSLDRVVTNVVLGRPRNDPSRHTKYAFIAITAGVSPGSRRTWPISLHRARLTVALIGSAPQREYTLMVEMRCGQRTPIRDLSCLLWKESSLSPVAAVKPQARQP